MITLVMLRNLDFHRFHMIRDKESLKEFEIFILERTLGAGWVKDWRRQD